MRCSEGLPVAVLLLLGGPLPAGGDEAEGLYRRMERTLASLQETDIRVETRSHWSLEGVPLTASVASRFQFQGPENVRVEISGRVEETEGDRKKAFRIDLVSNGNRMRMSTSGTELKPLLEGEPVRGLRRRLEALLLPSPILFLTDSLGREFALEEGCYVETSLLVSGFRLAGRERIGKRDTVKLTYLLEIESAEYPASGHQVTLWIDEETSLPVRRVTLPAEEEGGERIEETLQIARNPGIEPERFEIPREE